MSLNAPLSWLVTGVIAALPPVLMVSRDGSSVLFYLLVAVTLAAGVSRRQAFASRTFWQPWRLLAGAMALLVLAVVLSQAWNGDLYGSGIERALRFALMPLFVWLACQVDVRRLRHVQWGMAAGALAAGAMLIFPPVLQEGRPYTAEFSPYNTVTFSSLALLFSVSSLFLAFGAPLTRWSTAERLLKLAAGGVGLYGFVLSQTRSGLLALPAFLLIAVLLYDKASLRARMGALLGAVLLGAAVFAASDGLNRRIHEGLNQWEECRQNPLTDSSVCIRVQLAGAALHMYRSSPVFGVGDANFKREMRALGEQELLSAYVVREFGETHNDFLFHLARYGILGAAALLLVYLVPAWYFLRRLLRGADREGRVYAAVGLACCAGFAFFGIAELMFRGMRTVGFYSIWVAAMLALSARADPGR